MQSHSLLANPPAYAVPLTDDMQRMLDAHARKCVEVMPANRQISAQPTSVAPLIKIKKAERMKERELSTTEFLNLFDRKESLRMAYLPHYITQCVLYYVNLLTDYGSERQVDDIKKHSRLLKALQQEYFDNLRREMPDNIFNQFLAQRQEYLQNCGANLTLMYFTFNNQLIKKYGRAKHETLYTYCHIILALIEYVEDFDRKVNNRITQKLGVPCRNHGDARLSTIKVICKDIVRDYPIPVSSEAKTCVGVVANKAYAMVETML